MAPARGGEGGGKAGAAPSPCGAGRSPCRPCRSGRRTAHRLAEIASRSRLPPTISARALLSSRLVRIGWVTVWAPISTPLRSRLTTISGVSIRPRAGAADQGFQVLRPAHALGRRQVFGAFGQAPARWLAVVQAAQRQQRRGRSRGCRAGPPAGWTASMMRSFHMVPPEEAAGDEHRGRQAELLQHRQRQVVHRAVAVVEGDADRARRQACRRRAASGPAGSDSTLKQRASSFHLPAEGSTTSVRIRAAGRASARMRW
jgi:hypothetical protein